MRFIVVGGLAVSLNGYVRLTEAVDFVVDTSPENLALLIRCLANFGEGHGGQLTVEDFAIEPGAIRVIEAAEDCQMDIFTLVGGFSCEDLAAESETATVGDIRFQYASKPVRLETAID